MVTILTCDAAVIGGGLVGSALCYELSRRGISVVLVDRHDPGRATDAGAGILSPATSPEEDPDWCRLALEAGDYYPALAAGLASDGPDDPGYGQCGLLSIAREAHEEAWFESAARLAAARAPGVVQEVGPDEARELFPPLGDVWRALHHPAAARVDGRRMAAALLAAAERRGVVRLPAGATGVRATGGRATAVVTTAGEVACGALVVAGGAWSPEMGAALGASLPIEPMKGQILHLALPAAPTGGWPIVQPVLGYYLVPWPDGRVACGGTMEAAAGFDHRPTASGAHQLLRECLRTAPGLADATLLEIRVGIRPVAADGHPVLGPVPGWANVHVATGHGTDGLLLGPYSAALVARSMTGEALDPVAAPFGAGRFAG